MTRVLVLVGTRPEAIKLAPVVRALRELACENDRVTLCSTGQHREMLAQTLDTFGLVPDIDLGLMTPGQNPAEVVARLMMALGPVLADERPDWVIVQGDTATVAGGSLAAFMHGARVGHVEAGLRTRDRRKPFPEEINRRVAGVVADLHFAATRGAMDNLLAEGVAPEEILLTGNTVIDALRWASELVSDRPLPAGLDLEPGQKLVLVTAHRRESFGEPLRDICGALADIARAHPDVRVVYPVHLNPAVLGPVREILGNEPGISLIEPLGYSEFVSLLSRAHLVLTDSGGVQEEAPSLGIPVLVLREKTERPEAVDAGAVRLVGTDRDRIVAEASRLLGDDAAHGSMAVPLDVYGDGFAAQRIAARVLGVTPEPSEFQPAAQQRPSAVTSQPGAHAPSRSALVTRAAR